MQRRLQGAVRSILSLTLSIKLVLQISLRRPENSIYDVLMASTLFFVINELRKHVTYAHTY